jgi:hypothetical protein
MSNYFPESAHVNSKPIFFIVNFAPEQSIESQEATSTIKDMMALEKAWHVHFAQPRGASAAATLTSSLR